MKRLTLAVVGTFVLLLLGSGLLAFYFRVPPQPQVVTTNTTTTESPQATASPVARDQIPFVGELFGRDGAGLAPETFGSWESLAARIALRFSLAAFLAALLAFRPR